MDTQPQERTRRRPRLVGVLVAIFVVLALLNENEDAPESPQRPVAATPEPTNQENDMDNHALQSIIARLAEDYLTEAEIEALQEEATALYAELEDAP